MLQLKRLSIFLEEQFYSVILILVTDMPRTQQWAISYGTFLSELPQTHQAEYKMWAFKQFKKQKRLG